MKNLHHLSAIFLDRLPIRIAILAGAALMLSVQVAAQPAPAADPTARKDLVLKGDAKCTRCHSDDPKLLSIAKTKHGVISDSRTPTCTSCHGESDAHINKPGGANERPKPDRYFAKNSTTPVEQRNEACLTCHQKDTQRLHWQGSAHQSQNLACTSCHEVHTPHQSVLNKATQGEVCFTCHKSVRAQTHRISTHPIAAGKVGCSDCHNPHGSTGPKLLVKNSVNNTCYTCHAEKRGPFLWEHPPVVDDCMNCHSPHGSTTQPLLKARGPWLCQQCHGDGAPHPGDVFSGSYLPGRAVANRNTNPNAQSSVVNPITGARITANAPSERMPFRGCANCHSQIHGSNHPGGNRFLR